MKSFKIIGLMAAFVLLAAGSALAFHDAGVAECAGCHSMHASTDGVQGNGNPYLLNDPNGTDTCLSCHAAYGQFYGGLGYGPGGDFYWVTKTWSWDAHGHTTESTGDSHGHNVISPTHGIAADQLLTTAPGGDFLSSRLGCTSCHDPHGNSSFRLLYGGAQGPIYDGIRYDFDSDAPLAVGNSRRTYVGGGGNETDARHTVYKSGMSDWCANCHTTFHSENTTAFVHPTGQGLGSGVAGIYNAYVSSDDMSSGDVSTSYFGLVPFEDVDVDLDLVDTTDYTSGPAGNDKVMCLSCHRAHASPFASSARWDMGETFLIESHPAELAEGATQDDLDNMYYDYTFVTNQRSLCNKCHAKDQFDGPF